MLATNLHYNSQERYLFEEVLIDGKLESIKINKQDYMDTEEHKQIIIDMSEGIENSKEAQELKAELEKKLNATIKVIKHTADDQNTEEHFHFQILTNTEINNQTIYKIVNDFIKAKGANMIQVRIYDNSKKNSFLLSEEATAELLKVKEDNFSFIKKNPTSHEVEAIKGYKKEGSKNATGLGKLDRPNYILNGVSNEKAKLISRFGIAMFKTDNIEITKGTIKQAIKSFYMSIGQELGTDWDKYLNIEIEQSEEHLSINFNNLVVLENETIGSTAKNLLEENLSSIINNAISNEQLIIENDDRLKPKEKVLAELNYINGVEPETKREEVKEEPKNEPIEAQEDMINRDTYIDFITKLKEYEHPLELDHEKEELNKEVLKLETVRGILEDNVIDAKLQEIADKKELIAEQKRELEAVNKLLQEIENKENLISDYISDIDKLNGDIEKLNTVVSDRDITITEKEQEIKDYFEVVAEQEATILTLQHEKLELNETVIKLDTTITEKNEVIVSRDTTIETQTLTITKKEEVIVVLEEEKQELNTLVSERNTTITEQEQELKARNTELSSRALKIEELNTVVSDRDITITKQEEEIFTQDEELRIRENKNIELENVLAQSETETEEALKLFEEQKANFIKLQESYKEAKKNAVANFEKLNAEIEELKKAKIEEQKKAEANIIDIKKQANELIKKNNAKMEELKKDENCKKCNGTGSIKDPMSKMKIKCSACSGTGKK